MMSEVLFYTKINSLFIDAGVGTYNKKTFSDQRYSIWTMQGAYHNLPLINGIDQAFGKEYKATDVVFRPEQNKFQLNIGNAYPKTANIEHWNRSYTLEDSGLNITDEFKINNPSQANIIHFLVSKEPKIADGVINLGDGMGTLHFNATQFLASYDTIPQDDPRLSKVWGGQLYRINLKAKSIKSTGKYTFNIKK